MKLLLATSTLVLLLGVAFPLTAMEGVAVAQSKEACEGAPGSVWKDNPDPDINEKGCFPEDPDDLTISGLISKVTDTLLFIIGAISVVMIIIGGFQYVISGGDSTKVEKAKNTILYAVVGLVVAILAFALVNFVLANL